MHIKVGKTELDVLKQFVSEVNKDIITKFGGAHGHINEGNLSYSLFKALKSARKSSKNVFHKVWATHTLIEIAQNHAFTDGNKRTAYVIARLILYLGKHEFEVDYERAVNFLRKVADRKINYEEVYHWIDKHSQGVTTELSIEVQKFIGILAKVAI